mmetsp:Transcript_111/g.138  ORF Transcript_111/g.138 Transcript_111/m.138 type:complete len:434 (-) Transcript_111:75-1376(-)
MWKVLGALSLSALLGTIHALSDEELCLGSCTGSGSGEVCTFSFRLNPFAGYTGYYEVEGCEGVQPTLGMKQGVKYVFDQSDETNWFHPLGFAYGPDGVYGDNPELEPFVSAPNDLEPEGGECNETHPCPFTQFPAYKLNGEQLCDNGNTTCDSGDFGLDQYEGVWFSGGRDDWLDAGNFSVEVTIVDPATTEFFYFCHIHNQMSGRIKVLNATTGAQLDATDKVPIPYAYNQPDSFESSCGTFNVSQFVGSDACKDKTFLCGDDSNDEFGQCMNAIDCAMHEEMRVSLDNDPTVIFMHQMIAHHRNAVQMAKILLKLDPESLRCGTDYDGRRRLDGTCFDIGEDGGFPVITLLWEIINGQNAQITFMEAWLEDNQQPSHDNCEDEYVPVGFITGLSILGVVAVGATAAAVVFFRRSKKVDALATAEKETELKA